MPVCTKCNESKDQSKFRFDRADCKSCESKSRQARRERKRSRARLKEAPPPVFADKVPHSATYVVTYAQNATPVHRPFLEALKHYCAANKAQLIVIPGKYTNASSLHTKEVGHDTWWAEELSPEDRPSYLCVGRKDVGGLMIYGDISIQPTATRPLTGFEVFAGASSALFGHPRLQLKTVATADIEAAKILSTTGAVTLPNYTNSKAGKKSQAHHVIGAAVVERKGRTFHLRQINATDDGAFIDLDKEYTADGVREAPRALALVCGDIHVEKQNEKVVAATLYDEDSICNVVKPEQVVYHDTLDFNVRNHHEVDNFAIKMQRAHGIKKNIVEQEVMQAIEFLDKTPEGCSPVVIPSNHDEAMDRWLSETNIKQDPLNARFYHETWYKLLCEFEKTGKVPPAFEMCYRERGRCRATFIRRAEQFSIAGIECSFHGDKGTNGSRGNINSYAKLGVKTITGHSHSPEIMDGAYAVGVTGSLRQGYNEACPSSWAHAHVVIYGNGKRSLIFLSPEGKWRA